MRTTPGKPRFTSPFWRWSRAVTARGAGPRRTKLLTVEKLEDRVLLTADLVFSNSLTVDTSLYDASTVLVQLETNASADDLSTLLPGAHLKASSRYLPGLFEVHLGSDLTVDDALFTLGGSDAVTYVEPDYRIQLETVPNDPMFGSLWGLNNTGQSGGTVDADIDGPEVWSTTTGSSSTIVAVIDTGVDFNHVDLVGNIWNNVDEVAGNGIDDDGNGYIDDRHGYDFVNDDGNPMDDNGHGTHVAGTIGAVGNNGVGVVGVSWSVQIMALKFLDANGSGFTSDAVRALDYAVVNGATVSNNSWGGGGSSNALANAIQRAQNAGHIFVAAAGNDGTDNDSSPHYPSNYANANVISVAATDRNDNLASFSNYGASTVDLAAPGVSILSTTPGNSYATYSGTSMAAPHVTGVVALLQSQQPTWSYTQVIDQVLTSVDSVAGLQGVVSTGGRLNALAAVGSAGPDLTGAFITSATTSGPSANVVDTVRVAFNEAVDASSFTTGDVSLFQGPSGTISLDSITAVAGSNSQEFDIQFAAQSDFGNYSFHVGPHIADMSGNWMNQDQDGLNGESADAFIAAFSIQDVTTFQATDIPVAIVDQTLVSSTLDINQAITITDLDVQVDLQHTWVEDLRIYLRSPSGTQITLVENRGGGGDNFDGTVFDDSAGTSITAGSAPFSGSFRPEQPLSAFHGELAQGTWTLSVHDIYNFDEGTLNAWSLLLQGSTANSPPQLATIGDRTMPTSQGNLILSLSASDPDGDSLTFSGGVLSTGDPNSALALQLNQDLGLYGTGNYWEDWGGINEKWFMSASTGWYFITPDGAVYDWDGSLDLSTSPQIASLDPVYHADPTRLTDAVDSRSKGEVAYELDQQFDLYTTGNYWEGWGGLNEKWFMSATDGWFFVTPNGNVYQWDSSANLSTSTLQATLDATYFANPQSMFDVSLPTPSGAVGGNSVAVVGNQLVVDPAPGFVGDLRLMVTVTDGTESLTERFTVTVTSAGNQSGSVHTLSNDQVAETAHHDGEADPYFAASHSVVPFSAFLPRARMPVDAFLVESREQMRTASEQFFEQQQNFEFDSREHSDATSRYTIGELAGTREFLSCDTECAALEELLVEIDELSQEIRDGLEVGVDADVDGHSEAHRVTVS